MTTTTPNKYPTPAYLAGALLSDRVKPKDALKYARAYADALPRMDDRQTGQWLVALASAVGGNATMLTAYAMPSMSVANHYEKLAREAGWKDAAS